MNNTDQALVLDKESYENIRRLIKEAPARLSKGLFNLMVREGRVFIGDKKRSGQIRKRLQKRGWEDKFINSIMKYTVHKDKKDKKFGLEHRLEGGMLYSKKKKVHQIAEGQAKGGTLTAKDGYLIVPTGSMYKKPQPMKKFNIMLRRKELKFSFSKGKIFYFRKDSDELLFVGRKSIKLKAVKDLDVSSKWKKRAPKFFIKVEKMIGRELNRLDKRRAPAT